MAVRKFKTSHLKINVFLHNGTQYLGRDIPDEPFGDHENFISFWCDDFLQIIPLSEVKHIELYEDDELEN